MRVHQVAIFATIFLIIFGCKDKKNYVINGSFNGPISEEWIYKVKVPDSFDNRDSARIIDGKFKFEGKVDIPEVYAFHLPLDKMNGAALGFIEPGNLELNIDLQDWYGGSILSGGKLNDELIRLEEYNNNNYWNPIKELEKTLPNVDDAKAMTIRDSIEKLTIAHLQYELAYISDHLDSPMAIHLLHRNSLNLSLKEFGSYLTKIEKPLRKTLMFKTLEDEYKLQLEMQNEFEVETNSPEIEIFQEIINGTQLLNELINRNLGKSLYLDLWGTYCAPCKKEFPFLKKLYNQTDTSKTQFVYICIGSPKEEWLNLINSEQLKGQHYILDNENLNKFIEEHHINFQGVPRFMIVNRQGAIEYMDAPSPSSAETASILNSL